MNDNLLSKLRKILALTTSPVEGEAQAATAMLAKFLEQHNLDIADLEQRGAATKPQVGQRNHDLGKAAFKWKLTLAEAIAEHFFCYSLIDRRLNTVAFAGRPDNVESLQMLYQWLIDQIRRIASSERITHMESTGEHVDPLRWQCGFGEGAARRLGARLKEIRSKQVSSECTALVLSHRTEISDYLEAQYGYRIDGTATAREKQREQEWAEWRKREAEKQERLAKLKEENIEAFYDECPWERPEAKAAAERQEAEARKREERNARRRRGNGYRGRTISAEEWRKIDERQVAHRAGHASANQINLEPFLTEGTRIGEDKRIGS